MINGKTLLILLLFTISNTYGQKLHSIRFVHGGEELKPVGTLVISVEKLIAPSDRETDKMFGRSIKTDIKTFNTIEEYVNKNEDIITVDQLRIGNNNEYFKIILNDETLGYVGGYKMSHFFDGLNHLLSKQKRDKAVLEILKNS